MKGEYHRVTLWLGGRDAGAGRTVLFLRPPAHGKKSGVQSPESKVANKKCGHGIWCFSKHPCLSVVKKTLRPGGFALKFLRACDRSHPQKTGRPAAQTGHLPDEGPVRHGHLRRQGARFAQARQPVFPSVAAPGLGLEIQRARRGHPRFRRPRRPERAGGAPARRQAHQGISPALQRQFPRRQTVPDAQGEPERPDPELHLHAAEKGRRRALLRAVLEFRRAAQHARAGAAAVQPARLPRVHAGRGGLQALPLRASEILHRAVHRQCDARTISGAGATPRAISSTASATK